MSNCSIWPRDKTLSVPYHSGPEWTIEWGQWSGIPHSSNLQNCQPNHPMILCHIHDTRWGMVLTPLQKCSRCILQPQPTRLWWWWTDLLKGEEKQKKAQNNSKLRTFRLLCFCTLFFYSVSENMLKRNRVIGSLSWDSRVFLNYRTN